MGRTTKQLSGGGKDKFLRALIARERAIPEQVAERFGDAICDAIADIRVRREAWQPGAKSAVATTQVALLNVGGGGAAAPTAFDPFVFSALAVLTKHGAAALASKLDEIAAAEHLYALAKAQHLAVDASLPDPATVRAAIVKATEARLADRRAAAS